MRQLFWLFQVELIARGAVNETPGLGGCEEKSVVEIGLEVDETELRRCTFDGADIGLSESGGDSDRGFIVRKLNY